MERFYIIEHIYFLVTQSTTYTYIYRLGIPKTIYEFQNLKIEIII